MKPFFTFFAVFFFSFMNAQYTAGTLYLNDSIELKGLVKINSFGNIRFKLNADAKASSYDYKEIYGFDVKKEKYRYVASQAGFPPKLLNQRLDGKIILYSDEIYSPGHMIPAGYAGAGSGGMMMGGSTSTIYYMQKNNEIIRIGTKFSTKQLAAFDDCFIVIGKIQNKEFKKRDIYKIVELYNEKCAS